MKTEDAGTHANSPSTAQSTPRLAESASLFAGAQSAADQASAVTATLATSGGGGGVDLPIRCTYSNCDKTFRKRVLMEYHLKYHHYVDVDAMRAYDPRAPIGGGFGAVAAFTSTLTATPPRSMLSKRSIGGGGGEVGEGCDAALYADEYMCEEAESGAEDDEDEANSVVHCRCGDHGSSGFMIQVGWIKSEVF